LNALDADLTTLHDAVNMHYLGSEFTELQAAKADITMLDSAISTL